MEAQGLIIYGRRVAARLRGEHATMSFWARDVTGRPIERLALLAFWLSRRRAGAAAREAPSTPDRKR